MGGLFQNKRTTFAFLAFAFVLILTIFGARDRLYTSLELERLLSNSGYYQSAADQAIADASGTDTAYANDLDMDRQQPTDPEAALLPPVAVIIETEVHPNLIPLMTHFAGVLGSAWGMILFTLESNWTEPSSAPFRQLREEGRLEVRFLPASTSLANTTLVSEFLTRPWLWEELADFRRIFMFQADSMICANSEQKVDDWLKWDLVGAPIRPEMHGHGYNGGLGIRNPRAFLNITHTVPFKGHQIIYEDQFFFYELEKAGAILPTLEEAMPFAVETMWYDKPLGFHQVSRWLPDKMAQVEEWCPEIKLTVGRRALG